MSNPQLENSCVAKILQPCSCLISYLNIGHQIHPTDPAGPKYNEYLVLDSKKTIRIIHIKEALNQITCDKRESRLSISRQSLTEEYWFTRWNKPLKTGICNCSFRRSQRFSRLSDQVVSSSLRQSKQSYNCSIRMSDVNRLSNYDVPATKIINVETFVERLIQETYFEALQEYLMKKDVKFCSNKGVDNLAFSKGDDVDGVVLRRNVNDANYVKETTDFNQSIKVQNVQCVETKSSCAHKSNNLQDKPVVILLHGIGSTADVWWNIINNLSNKGYEIIAPDMLGHGYSSAPNSPGAYRFKNLLRNTLKVFDHYVPSDENRKAIVIGHSFGCSLATALARYRMQQIVQLILISGGGPTPLAAPIHNNEISVFGCLQTLIRPLLFCGLKRSFFYSSRGKHFKSCDVSNGIPSYVLKYIENGQNWPEGDAAFHRRILIPSLLVHGLQDTNVTLVQECEMERTIPRAFLELIPNAGHMSMLETPEHLAHMIICFMDWWTR